MGNLVAFINSFISYLLVFVVFAAVIIAAVKVGITARHKKDAKDAQNAQSADAQEYNIRYSSLVPFFIQIPCLHENLNAKGYEGSAIL